MELLESENWAELEWYLTNQLGEDLPDYYPALKYIQVTTAGLTCDSCIHWKKCGKEVFGSTAACDKYDQ
jgi:hypothetical protein